MTAHCAMEGYGSVMAAASGEARRGSGGLGGGSCRLAVGEGRIGESLSPNVSFSRSVQVAADCFLGVELRAYVINRSIGAACEGAGVASPHFSYPSERERDSSCQGSVRPRTAPKPGNGTKEEKKSCSCAPQRHPDSASETRACVQSRLREIKKSSACLLADPRLSLDTNTHAALDMRFLNVRVLS